jgi:hypothetical protein
MGDGVMSVVEEESARERRGSRVGAPLLDCVELSAPVSEIRNATDKSLLTLTRGILGRIVRGIAMIVGFIENACQAGRELLGDVGGGHCDCNCDRERYCEEVLGL